MNKTVQRILLCSIVICCILTLTGCSVNVRGTELEGINVIWAPLVFVWNWFWQSFTVGFWEFINTIWTTLPIAVVWIAGPIAYLLGAILYLVIFIISLVLYFVIIVVCGILWFLLAILNGFFRFI